MINNADKWIVVNGRVFRLERVVDEVSTALLLQRTLSVLCEVHLKRTDAGRWAIYWRSKKDNIECTPKAMASPAE
ncbi:MAG: hypothetical protein ACXACD_11645 [Candidatus Thorarchaeota archaeon]|jgi:hypothetical protein